MPKTLCYYLLMFKKDTYLIFLLSIVLFSCGGGGGGGGSTPTTPTAPAPTVNFSANPTSVLIDSESTLTWSSSNASSCSASGAWSGARATSGSETVTITTVGNISFTITCSGEGGNRSATVTIEGYRQTDGVVVDGYISGADIFIDENANFIADSNESTTTSDNEGKFTIKYADGSLVSLGGTDLDSQTLLNNLLITHKMTGHSDFKAITPVTSVAAFMQDASSANAALGIDTSIDIFTFDPVANKGDSGINDYLYEKGNQLTVLAFALQNIVNDLNATNETTQDYFKAIAEELDAEFANTTTKVDIETATFITNVINNILSAKSISMDETIKANTITALAGVLPIIQVKSANDLTTAVIRFSLSTLQTDIVGVANGTASEELITSYTSDILNYIAEDQNVDSNEITPDITAIADTSTVEEDGSVTINVLANDSFITTAPTALSASNGNNGSTALAESSPEQVVYTPNADFNGTDTFTYSISQGDKTSSAEVTVTVSAVNDAPTIDIASTIQVSENQTAVTTVSVSDIDEDELTLTLGGTDADSLNLSNDNVLTFKESPNFEDQSSYSITLSLSDGFETTSKNIQIIIDDVQEVFINPDEVIEQEDSDIRIDVLKNDSFSGANYEISFDNPINGTLVIDKDPEALQEYGHQTLMFSPVLNWFGEENITYYLSAGGETRSGNIKVTYIPVNDPPVIDSITQTIDVSVEPNSNGSGNIYVINGQQAKELKFNNAVKYRFVHPEEHPLRFSTTDDGTHNGGSEYLENVDTSTPGLTIISFDTNQTETTLYYYCEIHSNMGSSFSKSNYLINMDENLTGELITIIASDVDNEILSYTISGDDKQYFSRDSSGSISIDVEPDFEDPKDSNLDNRYSMLFNVSDEEFTTSKEIDLNIIDLNLPATLLHEFSNPRCENDPSFGNKSAIDFDGNTIITQGNQYCPGSSGNFIRFFGFQHNGSSWQQMESKQYLPGYQGPTTNPILGGVSLLLSDTGTRFAKEIACTLLIQYDYNQRYADVYNWNEVQERGGESSLTGVGSSCNRAGFDEGSQATDMSRDGKIHAVVSKGGDNIYGQPAFGRLKIFELHESENYNITIGTRYDVEFNENNLGEAVMNDVSLSENGDTLAISYGSLGKNGETGAHFRIYEWNDDPSISTYEAASDRIYFCENDLFNVGTNLQVKLSGDGNTILLWDQLARVNDQGFQGAFCVMEKTSSGWQQKGQLISGDQLMDNWSLGAGMEARGLSKDGKRIVIKFRTGTTASEAYKHEIRIYEWSPLDNLWKQSGTNITISDEWEFYSGQESYEVSGDGTRLTTMVSQRNTNDNGRLRLYFLPKN